MTVQSRVIEIIRDEALNHEISLPDIINLDDSLDDKLGFDSIMLLQFILRLEDEFELEIDDDFLSPELFDSLDNIIQFLEKIQKIQVSD